MIDLARLRIIGAMSFFFSGSINSCTFGRVRDHATEQRIKQQIPKTPVPSRFKQKSKNWRKSLLRGQEIGVPVTSTPRRIMAYEDFNELKQMVESLKRKVQETNSTTKLIKTVVVFQVITLILVLYTLLQS